MKNSAHNRSWTLSICSWPATAALAMAILFALAWEVPSARAQTFQVLFNFPSYGGGFNPEGLAVDRAGNFYGAMEQGLFGGVFKFSRSGSGWIFTNLYRFQGDPDGSTPAGITVGPDGSLYGTTGTGGIGPCDRNTYYGCGTVFRLQPPATGCKSVSCPWKVTILYSFQGTPDLQYPESEIAFDQAGNLYGTATQGGAYGKGGVYQLARSQSGWTYTILHSFSGSPDGDSPVTGLTLDSSGNMYGTTLAGGTGSGPNCGNYGCGTVYEVSPSGSGWSETILYNFTESGADGYPPYAGLLLDPAGDLYGTTEAGGSTFGGTVFELSPTNGSFAFSLLYTLPAHNGDADFSQSRLVMDKAGNLYGATSDGGYYGFGMVFKLSPGYGGWTFTDLHDFAGPDGYFPSGDLVLDASGNLYGTALEGGSHNEGVIWEITP